MHQALLGIAPVFEGLTVRLCDSCLRGDKESHVYFGGPEEVVLDLVLVRGVIRGSCQSVGALLRPDHVLSECIWQGLCSLAPNK